MKNLNEEASKLLGDLGFAPAEVAEERLNTEMPIPDALDENLTDNQLEVLQAFHENRLHRIIALRQSFK